MLSRQELRYFLGLNSFVVLFISLVAYLYLKGVGADPLIKLFLAISLFTIFINLALYLVFPKNSVLPFWISLILFDIVVTIMSIATGGIESRITFLFVLPIVFVVYFQGLKGGVIQSAISLLMLYILTRFKYHIPGEHFYLVSSPFTKNFTYFLVYTLIFTSLTGVTLYLSNLLKRQERDFIKFRVSSEEILNTVPSGILTVSPQGEILFANKSTKEILNDSELSQFLHYVLQEHTAVRSEVELGGKILGYSVKILEDGTRTIVFQDLTEVKKLEEERKELERLAFLGELSANLAHEIRNPVQAINMAMELILSKKVNPDEQLLKSVMYDAERLSEVVNRFLQYAKIPELRISEVRVADVIQRAFDNISTLYNGNYILRNHVPPEFIIPADETKLEELFSNLFRNSIEAETKEYIDTLFLKPREQVELVDNTVYIARNPAVIVRDYGRGMDSETLKRAKELFFSTKKGGTGFGLAICERIMKAHGGNLLIHSAPGKGTDVILEFKLS